MIYKGKVSGYGTISLDPESPGRWGGGTVPNLESICVGLSLVTAVYNNAFLTSKVGYFFLPFSETQEAEFTFFLFFVAPYDLQRLYIHFFDKNNFKLLCFEVLLLFLLNGYKSNKFKNLINFLMKIKECGSAVLHK